MSNTIKATVEGRRWRNLPNSFGSTGPEALSVKVDTAYGNAAHGCRFLSRRDLLIFFGGNRRGKLNRSICFGCGVASYGLGTLTSTENFTAAFGFVNDGNEGKNVGKNWAKLWSSRLVKVLWTYRITPRRARIAETPFCLGIRDSKAKVSTKVLERRDVAYRSDGLKYPVAIKPIPRQAAKGQATSSVVDFSSLRIGRLVQPTKGGS
nr:hypothetical protein Iba_chr11dCG12080 [Ipomoea batatas]